MQTLFQVNIRCCCIESNSSYVPHIHLPSLSVRAVQEQVIVTHWAKTSEEPSEVSGNFDEESSCSNSSFFQPIICSQTSFSSFLSKVFTLLNITLNLMSHFTKKKKKSLSSSKTPHMMFHRCDNHKTHVKCLFFISGVFYYS